MMSQEPLPISDMTATSTTTGTARLPKTIQSPPRFRSAHPFIIEEPLQGEPMSRPDYADSSAAARAKTSV